MLKSILSKKKKDIVFFLLLLLFFEGLVVILGAKCYGDTITYELFNPTREPLYCLIMYLFRILFREECYTCLAIFQSFLAACIVFVLWKYIVYQYPIKNLFLQIGLLLALISPHIVTPLFSESRLVLTNAMMTEGITLSLYQLAFYFLLRLVWEQGCENQIYWGNVIKCSAVCLLLVLTRGQMLMLFVALGLVFVYTLIRRKHHGKSILAFLGIMLIVFGLKYTISGTYYEITNQIFTQTPYGKVTALTSFIYVADRDAGEKINNPDYQRLFYEIYDMCDEQGILYKDAPKSIKAEAAFYEAAHDQIKMDIAQPILDNYAVQVYGRPDYLFKLTIMDQIASDMIKDIAGPCLGTWLEHYFRNIVIGLIRTVATLHPVLYLPCALEYVALIWLGIFFYKKKKIKVVQMLGLVALLTAGVVASVSLFIMCLSRYMIYNTSLIYAVTLIMIYELFQGNSEAVER